MYRKPDPSLQYVTLGKASNYQSYVLTVNHCDGEHVQGEKVLWIFFAQWSDLRLCVNNHTVQALYMETSQLSSSSMPVICPTVNQALKQAPRLSCATCGVQHKARSSLYTLWCGIIWDGGRKKSLWTRHIALSTGLADVCALTMGVCFLLLYIASDPDDPLTRLLFVI